jgi:tRNA 2-selenouridine synthase
LREARGEALVTRWCGLARDGQTETLVAELLADHYDPIYLRSMARNFARFAQAGVIAAADGEPATLDRVAAALHAADAAAAAVADSPDAAGAAAGPAGPIDCGP